MFGKRMDEAFDNLIFGHFIYFLNKLIRSCRLFLPISFCHMFSLNSLAAGSVTIGTITFGYFFTAWIS